MRLTALFSYNCELFNLSFTFCEIYRNLHFLPASVLTYQTASSLGQETDRQRKRKYTYCRERDVCRKKRQKKEKDGHQQEGLRKIDRKIVAKKDRQRNRARGPGKEGTRKTTQKERQRKRGIDSGTQKERDKERGIENEG